MFALLALSMMRGGGGSLNGGGGGQMNALQKMLKQNIQMSFGTFGGGGGSLGSNINYNA
ncbi:MAG: hypothetical protein KC476_03895 [Cyanobacteria bacterium HKST-UBA06]|nr:hypothetical protein [Cyanobacteria bacterium HKST-UBA04]MCA9807076.1 hypothetical protein [Cyanobacteria bacterium HKST-UBA06]